MRIFSLSHGHPLCFIRKQFSTSLDKTVSDLRQVLRSGRILPPLLMGRSQLTEVSAMNLVSKNFSEEPLESLDSIRVSKIERTGSEVSSLAPTKYLLTILSFFPGRVPSAFFQSILWSTNRFQSRTQLQGSCWHLELFESFLLKPPSCMDQHLGESIHDGIQ